MLIHKTAPIFTSLDLPRRAGFPILGAPTGPPGTASEQQCTVALCKNIVGTGVLTLPAGVSHLSDAGASSSDALIVAREIEGKHENRGHIGNIEEKQGLNFLSKNINIE